MEAEKSGGTTDRIIADSPYDGALVVERDCIVRQKFNKLADFGKNATQRKRWLKTRIHSEHARASVLTWTVFSVFS